MISITDNGNSSPFPWEGGYGLFTAAGNFGGATVKLQYLPPGSSTWRDVGSVASLTEAGGCNFALPGGVQLRVNTSGGGSILVEAYILEYKS